MRKCGQFRACWERACEDPAPTSSARSQPTARPLWHADWREKTLAKVREIIHETDPEIVEELHPRRPQGRCGLEGSHPRCSGAQSQEQAEAPASEQQAGRHIRTLETRTLRRRRTSPLLD